MGKLLIILLAIQAAFLTEAKPFPTILEQPDHKPELVNTLSVFKPGIFPTADPIQVKKSDSSSPPTPLLIFTPTVAGTYSILLFFHGTCLENSFYTVVLQHIASHGYIVVAPQLYSCTIFGGTIPVLPISGPEEVEFSAEVANWLSETEPSGLQSVLPTNVKANVDKIALGGHSRGGKTAFALALGYAEKPLSVEISALIGLDPVDGTSKQFRPDPKILTYVPHSFNLSIPVTVIGTGLGNQTSCWLVCPACAPNEVNHVEFYNECRAPASHFVTTDYGHMDMLDDDLQDLMGSIAEHMCKNSRDPKDPMRRTVGGIIVAFMKAYFHGTEGDYLTILRTPSVAPATLDPVQSMDALNYAPF